MSINSCAAKARRGARHPHSPRHGSISDGHSCHWQLCVRCLASPRGDTNFKYSNGSYFINFGDTGPAVGYRLTDYDAYNPLANRCSVEAPAPKADEGLYLSVRAQHQVHIP